MSALDTRIAHSCHLKRARALDQDQSLGKDIEIVKENLFLKSFCILRLKKNCLKNLSRAQSFTHQASEEIYFLISKSKHASIPAFGS